MTARTNTLKLDVGSNLRLGLALGALASLAGGCDDGNTNLLRVNASAWPTAIDTRTGVVAITDFLPGERYETTLRRLEGDTYVGLTPPVPGEERTTLDRVSWFGGSALASDMDGRLLRYTMSDGWSVVSTDGCDPDAERMVLSDARAMDDAWLVSINGRTSTSVICHFDGVNVSAVEEMTFAPNSLVVFGEYLFAMDGRTGRTVRRHLDGETWSSVTGLSRGEAVAQRLVVREEAVYAHYVDASRDLWWNVSVEPAVAIEGTPGFDGERWRVEVDEQLATRCEYSLWSNSDVCIEIVETSEHRVLRVDGTEPIEVGYLRLEHPYTTWFDSWILGPGQLALLGGGTQYVTAGR